MKTTPLISIVVPMYNAEKYIAQCLESAINQKCEDYEVVVVDDGSKDSSLSKAQEMVKKSDRLRVVHQENKGVINARKTGVKNSKGRYILNLDSDDWLRDDFLQKIESEIRRNEPDMVFTGFTEVDGGVEKAQYQNIENGVYSGNKKLKVFNSIISTGPFFTSGIYPSLCFSCIKRELMIDAMWNLPETFSIGEDLSVTYPCIFKAEIFSIIDATGYYYRMQNESMTHTFDFDFSKKLVYMFDYLQTALPAGIVGSSQFGDYVVYESCLMVSIYLKNGIKEYSYKELIQRIESALNHPIIDNAFRSFDIKRKSIPMKEKVKIILIRKRWFKLYRKLGAIAVRRLP